jgi:hypothetical protein
MLTSTRTRFPINPDGKSGHMTLHLPDLVQDTSNRKRLAAEDTAAYLAAGGMQAGKEPTFAQSESEYIRQLTDTTDVDTFLGL